MTGSRPCHANHSVSIQNRFVTKHDKAMFLGAVPCEVPPKPHTKYVISMGIKHAVPLGNLDCKDFAGLPVVAVCAMGVCWSPDVLLGLSWFTVVDSFFSGNQDPLGLLPWQHQSGRITSTQTLDSIILVFLLLSGISSVCFSVGSNQLFIYAC